MAGRAPRGAAGARDLRAGRRHRAAIRRVGVAGAPGHGLWAGEGHLAVDAITASRILRLLYPGRPLFLLGESMGSAVAVLAVTGAIGDAAGIPVAEADGVILSAPAVWGRAT